MIRRVASLLTLLSLAACAPLQRATVTQLPQTARPVHYDLALVPDTAARTFTGHVDIDIEVTRATREITLNTLELRITRAQLDGEPIAAGAPGDAGAATAADAAGIVTHATTQTTTFRFERPVRAGQHRLSIDYDGRINAQPNGLFVLDYTTANGPKQALFSQLETADARRVFPCWDEPGYKATFSLTVTAPRGETVVSNMPAAASETVAGDRVRTRFALTPRMSTYLLFVASGQFERDTRRVGDTEVGVVTRAGALAQARHALDSSATLLGEYDRYFGIPYPLPKLDNIAAPGSSQTFAAMENWGAILSFEYALLLDPAMATQDDARYIFVTAAHEIAHQWFGNLVTMRWWDDLWLNESFASWMEGRVTERVHPEWQTALGAVAVRERAMALDALQATHPIVRPLATVEEVNQAFDTITYMKGQAVLRMLEDYTGEDAWRDGVRAYLRGHAYGNATSADLWRALTSASHRPVTQVARDFTRRGGVPLVRVDSATCRDGATTLALTQGEFSRDVPDKRPQRWRVPVTVQTVGGTPVRTLLAHGHARVTVPGCGAVVVNAGQAGYYRTRYAPALFATLAQDYARLAPIDQIGVFADTWALGFAGQQPVADALALARAAPRDASPQLWQRIAQSLASLDEYYGSDSPARQAWRRFATALLRPILADTGWVPRAGESSSVATLREDLLGALSALGDANVIAEALRRRAAAATDPNAIPAAMRRSIIGIVARHADADTWESLRAEARSEPSPLVREYQYAWLGSASDPALAQRALELALTPEPGPTQSAVMIRAVSAQHPRLAFDFARSHRAAVLQSVDNYSRGTFIASLASRSTDADLPALIRADAEQNLPADARATAERVAAGVEDRARVRMQRLPAVDAWIATLR